VFEGRVRVKVDKASLSGATMLLLSLLGPAATSAPVMAAGQASPSLDYQYYKTNIEPIFLKQRAPDEGVGQRCANCHARIVTRLRLQPLATGAAGWTEQQSRQNFQVVSALVTPGDPTKSPLLLHPLAAEVGGDPSHTGGKFWKTQDNPEWQLIAAWVKGAQAAGGEGGAPAAPVAKAPAVALDYEFFKTEVQSVFLKKRPGLARCYSCHGAENGEGSAVGAMRFQRLSPGATTWNEEQSRKNFEVVSQKVSPGDTTASRLLIHPLRFEAGGDLDHMGGFQFQSPDDPDWQILARWVKGEKASPAK
jgi:hypothetical protein